MSTLVTGGRGVLGREFVALLKEALYPPSSELDVRDADAVVEYVAKHSVDTVFHCAAMTSVRQCEEERLEAYRVNVEGTLNICSALGRQANQPFFVFISTACVFPGDDPEACYSEDDTPNPKNFYALTKLLAEHVVTGWVAGAQNARALIIRTNFAERGPWKYPAAFEDRYGTYLYPDTIAHRVVELRQAEETGLVHVCGRHRLSMLEFARLSDPGVGSISMRGYEGPPVTMNMCLASNRVSPLALQ